MIWTGNSRAISDELRPPLDCISKNSPIKPTSDSRSLRRSRYFWTAGLAYALTTVVVDRSYSLSSRSTWYESVTGMPGARRAAMSPIRRSWAGFANELSRHTAIDSTPWDSSSSIAASTDGSSRSVSTRPDVWTRSSTSTRIGRVTSGSGKRICKSLPS